MDIKDLAEANESSYEMTGSGNKETRIEKAQSRAPEGYDIIPHLSDRMISTFQNQDDWIIAHRGSDFAGTHGKKDLKSDFNIMIGNEDGDAIHKKRTAKTERIIRDILRNEPQSNIYLSGHSLGGSTSYSAMVNSKYVRNNVTALHTFNAGSSPFQTKKDMDKKAEDIIKEKATHHRIKGDFVSENVKKKFIGTHKKYDTNKSVPIHKRVLNILSPLLGGLGIAYQTYEGVKGKLQKHSIQNFS